MTGNELKKALGQLGYTVAEAARRLGVNYTTVSRKVHSGSKKIDGPTAECVRCWLELRDSS